MNSTKVLEEYHKFYGTVTFVEFRQNCDNHASMGLKLQVVREKFKLYIESRYEAYKRTCRSNFVEVVAGLRSVSNPQSPNGASIQKLIDRTRLTHWYENWWQYAKLFSKTEGNFEEYHIDDADLSTFLHSVMSCTLFSSNFTTKAYAIIRLRNAYSHAPTYQTNTERLNKLFLIIQKFEELLIH